jgi:putative acetyltransferase
MVTIRAENAADADELSAIRSINEAAFAGCEEADLVDKLRTDGDVLISLVAELDQQVVGHILFSRMWIETPAARIAAVALAPVAILPASQRQGIGGQLIRHGLDVLRDRGERIVIVVGHPAYYPRFGFSSETARAFESPFSGDSFMAMELSPGALDGIRGKVIYPAAFGLSPRPTT